MWRPFLLCFGVLLVVGFVFGFRLGSLTHGVSAPEQSYVMSIYSGKALLNNPLYLAHKVPIYILFKLGVHAVGAYRAVSALFAISAVVSCFFILREWYSLRVAILGTWLFMSSAWVLHIGRLATPEASFFLVLPLLWAAIWLYFTTLHKTALIVLSVLLGLCLYLPGMVWFFLVLAIWQRKAIWREVKRVPIWYRIGASLVLVLILLPLLLAVIRSADVAIAALGLPSHPPTIKQLGQNAWNLPVSLFWRGPADPVRWLRPVPVLDAFSGVMLLLGLYSLRYHVTLIRTQVLLVVIGIASVLIVLGGPVTLSALVPILYLFIAAGIAFFLQQWFTVFPRNPLARGIATTFVSITVLLVSYYHINHYFIAWPQTPATRTAFVQTSSL